MMRTNTGLVTVIHRISRGIAPRPGARYRANLTFGEISPPPCHTDGGIRYRTYGSKWPKAKYRPHGQMVLVCPYSVLVGIFVFVKRYNLGTAVGFTLSVIGAVGVFVRP